MSDRGHINLTTKLAAAICELLQIPHDHARTMSEDQVLSLVNWDHYPIRKADGGEDKHFNLVPRSIMAHRKKTAEIDVPQMRKADRLRAAHIALQNFLATGEKPPLPERPKRKIASRPMPGTRASGLRKRMDGTVERRA